MGSERDQVDSAVDSKAERRRLGAAGEELAARFLRQKGFKILERNYRCRLGEIDLIAAQGERLLFVEVKTRRSQQEVSALELISHSKQIHISKVAQYYCARHPLPGLQALPGFQGSKGAQGMAGEFALVVVDWGRPSPSCELFESIFPLAWGY